MDERLTPGRMSQLREALRGQELEAIVLLALATGMRRDDLLQLHWQESDLDRREVLVGDPKAQSRWRTVRFPENVADLLRQHRRRQRPTRRPAGRAASHLDRVFPGDTGGILPPAALVKRWSAFLAQAALPRLHVQDLRRAHRWVLREQSRAAGEEHGQGRASMTRPLSWQQSPALHRDDRAPADIGPAQRGDPRGCRTWLTELHPARRRRNRWFEVV